MSLKKKNQTFTFHIINPDQELSFDRNFYIIKIFDRNFSTNIIYYIP